MGSSQLAPPVPPPCNRFQPLTWAWRVSFQMMKDAGLSDLEENPVHS